MKTIGLVFEDKKPAEKQKQNSGDKTKSDKDNKK